MCVVSMIASEYDKILTNPTKPWPITPEIYPPSPYRSPPVNSEDFEALRDEVQTLRRQVQEMKNLLEKAYEYDKATNQHECADDGKLERLEKIAEAAGIDCKELFAKLRSSHTKKKRAPRKKTT